MKLARQPPRTPQAAGRRAALAAYVTALADLAAPKRALPILADGPRLDAYDAGIRAAVQRRPGEACAPPTTVCCVMEKSPPTQSGTRCWHLSKDLFWPHIQVMKPPT